MTRPSPACSAATLSVCLKPSCPDAPCPVSSHFLRLDGVWTRRGQPYYEGHVGRGRSAKEMRAVDIMGTVVRFIVSALVLMFVGFIVPGFAPLTFFHALLAALVIAAIGWVIEATMGARVSPFGRGVVGFIISAVVIWATQFFVPGMQVSILGALLAAALIGVIDL